MRVDDMSNVSGVRKGTGGGPTVVFCGAHGHGVSRRHRREGEARRRHPARAGHRRRHVEPDGHARDVPRARSRRREDQGRPDLPGAACRRSSGCSARSTGSRRAATSRTCSSPSTSPPTRSGTARCASRSSSSSTRRPARTRWRAVAARARRRRSRRRSPRVYEIPLPPIAEGLGTFKLPVAQRRHDRRRDGRSTPCRAKRGSPSICARSTRRRRTRLEQAVEGGRAARRRAGRRRLPHGEDTMGIDYSKARPQAGAARLIRSCRRRSRPAIIPKAGHAARSFRRTSAPPTPTTPSSMGIPAVADRRGDGAHRRIAWRSTRKPAASCPASSRSSRWRSR